MDGIGWFCFRLNPSASDDSNLACAGFFLFWFLFLEAGSVVVSARIGNRTCPFSGLDGKVMVDHGESIGVELGLFPRGFGELPWQLSLEDVHL